MLACVRLRWCLHESELQLELQLEMIRYAPTRQLLDNSIVRTGLRAQRMLSGPQRLLCSRTR